VIVALGQNDVGERFANIRCGPGLCLPSNDETLRRFASLQETLRAAAAVLDPTLATVPVTGFIDDPTAASVATVTALLAQRGLDVRGAIVECLVFGDPAWKEDAAVLGPDFTTENGAAQLVEEAVRGDRVSVAITAGCLATVFRQTLQRLAPPATAGFSRTRGMIALGILILAAGTVGYFVEKSEA
jgi:hypothetical protein